MAGSSFFNVIKRVVINQWYEIKGGPTSGGSGVVGMEETSSQVKPSLKDEARTIAAKGDNPSLAFEKDSGGWTKKATEKVSVCDNVGRMINRFMHSTNLSASDKAVLEKLIQENKDVINCTDYDLKKII